MDLERVTKIINSQISDFSISLMRANDIVVPMIFPDINKFWKNHGYNKEYYLNLIQELYKIYDNIDIQKLNFYDFTTSLFFTRMNVITVRYVDGHYQLATDGMHRSLAAQELDAIIPVRIIE